MASSANNGISALTTPERNNYFYGMLLDESKFTRETNYFNQKRWLLNRLLLGSGVVCGLNVAVDANKVGNVVIQPGLAVDKLGREILVPNEVTVNALTFTDELGKPSGGVAAGGTVIIAVAYKELQANPVPTMVADCTSSCKCDTIQEGFLPLVLLDPAMPSALPGLPSGCTSPPLDTQAWVPLARFSVNSGNTLVREPNTEAATLTRDFLNQTISQLSRQLAQLTGTSILRYVSGDNQFAAKDTVLQPLVVQLIDVNGVPVGTTPVNFSTSNGSVNPLSVATDANTGIAISLWTLGGTSGTVAKATAVSTASKLSIVFSANVL